MSTEVNKDVSVLNSSQEADLGERVISRRTLIKVGWTVPVVAMIAMPRNVFASGSVQPGPSDFYCNFSSGYYKKCGPDQWNVETFVIGGKSYSKYVAYDILKQAPAGGDKWTIIFHQRVAAELNRQHGITQGRIMPSDIDKAITNCDTWLLNHKQGDRSWDVATAKDYNRLADFNQDSYCW